MTDNFPSDTYASWAEHEADRIAADRRSRQTSRLCRCTKHTPKECGNLAERLPDRPLCFSCFVADRDGRPCLSVQVSQALQRESQTHCECGGTLLDGENIHCASCGKVVVV